MKPKFKRMAGEHESVLFVVAQKFPKSRKLANVNNLPTFAAYRKCELVNQVQTSKVESLKEFVNATASH